ncbi:MAG: hypothetical protein DYG96_08455 [Chlorobi bacterium CHB2]|nr:hypothetical protein [Chlorobi bacterium CHB2]
MVARQPQNEAVVIGSSRVAVIHFPQIRNTNTNRGDYTMIDEVQDMKELMEELREEGKLTREQAFVIYGRVATMYEFSLIDKSEWRELMDLIPLTTDDLQDIRV